ncbi:MAG TPA: hypothetical protein VFV75_19095 [Candidatus Polarisedimenticolaceae bacterium]|nr:hypothetical protein [Candidatus Polarisedimenticolaceae bacterium]
MFIRRTALLLTTLLFSILPAAAAEMGLRGWGLRAGVASDPDQLLLGAHWDLGDVAPQFRMVPNVQLGVGDDATVLEGTLPVHYVFGKVDAGFAPYVGAGLAVAWIDVDHDHGHGNDDFLDDEDDSDVELGAKVLGGLEWTMRSKNKFFVELNLGIGDLHDFQAVAGWTF